MRSSDPFQNIRLGATCQNQILVIALLPVFLLLRAHVVMHVRRGFSLTNGLMMSIPGCHRMAAEEDSLERVDTATLCLAVTARTANPIV